MATSWLGTDHDDVLLGSAGNDLIWGTEGGYLLCGRDGNGTHTADIVIIAALCCEAWNKLTDRPWKIVSIGMHDRTHGS